MTKEVERLFKAKLVDALRAFDGFCNEHGLDYYACSGTTIGAVRHQGFIPWDDDIDVFMLRADYDRLMELSPKLASTHYRIAKLGDEGYIYPFAKFIDTDTTLIEQNAFPDCCIGVYVDVFPLDEVSSSIDDVRSKKVKFERLLDDFQHTYRRLSFGWIAYNVKKFRLAELFRSLSIGLGSEKRKEAVRDRFIRYENDWSKEHGPLLYTHHAIYKLENELFEKSVFSDYRYMPFEDFRIRVNTEYDKYLTQLFGDYMTPPPVDKRVSAHHHYYLNLKEGLSLEEATDRIRKGERLVY